MLTMLMFHVEVKVEGGKEFYPNLEKK